MAKMLRTLAVLLFALTAFAARPANAQSCDYLVTCFAYLPEHSTANPFWQYSHLCCDLEDHTTIWAVYIAPNHSWHLVSTAVPP